MDNFLIIINALTEMATKKEDLLENLLNITMNQRVLMMSNQDEEELASFIKIMNQEKQTMIDEVIKLDEIFQASFKKIQEDFGTKAQLYKNEIKFLQEKIREITDLDVKIKIEEEKNRNFVSKNEFQAEKIVTCSRKNVLEKYQKNKKQKLS